MTVETASETALAVTRDSVSTACESLCAPISLRRGAWPEGLTGPLTGYPLRRLKVVLTITRTGAIAKQTGRDGCNDDVN